MGRPKIPLISRERAVVAALQLIDERGIEGLNIRALGDQLGVNGASLYHHFHNKQDILQAVAAHVLDTSRLPVQPDVDWRKCVVDGAVAYRRALLRHPKALPLLMPAGPSAVPVGFWSALIDSMRRAGLPDEVIVTLLRASEALNIGSAIQSRQLANGAVEPWHDLVSDALGDEQRFRSMYEALVDGVLMQNGLATDGAPRSMEPTRVRRRATAAGR